MHCIYSCQNKALDAFLYPYFLSLSIFKRIKIIFEKVSFPIYFQTPCNILYIMYVHVSIHICVHRVVFPRE